MIFIKRYLKIKWLAYKCIFENTLNKFRIEQHNEDYLALVGELRALLK